MLYTYLFILAKPGGVLSWQRIRSNSIPLKFRFIINIATTLPARLINSGMTLYISKSRAWYPFTHLTSSTSSSFIAKSYKPRQHYHHDMPHQSIFNSETLRQNTRAGSHSLISFHSTNQPYQSRSTCITFTLPPPSPSFLALYQRDMVRLFFFRLGIF